MKTCAREPGGQGRKAAFTMIGLLLVSAGSLHGAPECRVVPQPGNRASFVIGDIERLGWHFGPGYPRPFFYPFKSPLGTSLTRMGHPGAPDHDHHRSIWFAHADVAGNNFWTDGTEARIRQKQWLVYGDGEKEAVMAVRLAWYDGEGRELMEQELVAAFVEDSQLGCQLELQSRFVPAGETLELGKTNFGFLAVRMAKEFSGHFGGGVISDSEGRTGEKEIFGKRARWIDYSGPHSPEKKVQEGITYFDHPSNPRYPTYWHLREDGWMGASFGLKEAFLLKRGEPLQLRYLLLGHARPVARKSLDDLAAAFGERPAFEVTKSTRPHRHFEVRRVPVAPRSEPSSKP